MASFEQGWGGGLIILSYRDTTAGGGLFILSRRNTPSGGFLFCLTETSLRGDNYFVLPGHSTLQDWVSLPSDATHAVPPFCSAVLVLVLV